MFLVDLYGHDHLLIYYLYLSVLKGQVIKSMTMSLNEMRLSVLLKSLATMMMWIPEVSYLKETVFFYLQICFSLVSILVFDLL